MLIEWIKLATKPAVCFPKMTRQNGWTPLRGHFHDFYRIYRVQMLKTAGYQRKVMTRWTR